MNRRAFALLALVATLIVSQGAMAWRGLELLSELVAASKVAPALGDVDTETLKTLGGVGQTATWSESVTTTAEDLWASANVPAMLTAPIRSQVRFITVTNAGPSGGGTDIAVCTRLGPSTETGGSPAAPALSCTLGSSTGHELLTAGAFFSLRTRQPTAVAPWTAADGVIPLWTMARAAGPVIVSVTVGW